MNGRAPLRARRVGVAARPRPPGLRSNRRPHGRARSVAAGSVLSPGASPRSRPRVAHYPSRNDVSERVSPSATRSRTQDECTGRRQSGERLSRHPGDRGPRVEARLAPASGECSAATNAPEPLSRRCRSGASGVSFGTSPARPDPTGRRASRGAMDRNQRVSNLSNSDRSRRGRPTAAPTPSSAPPPRRARPAGRPSTRRPGRRRPSPARRRTGDRAGTRTAGCR